MTGAQKVISAIIALMWCVVFTGVSCGVAWLIETLFKTSVNYYIAGGIGVFIFILIFLVGLNQYLTFKKFSEEIEKNW